MATHPSILAWRIPWTEEEPMNIYIYIHKTGKMNKFVAERH